MRLAKIIGKLGELVRGLKASQVDVIVAAGFPVILACKVANVPTVVAFGGGDPVATRLIDTRARPGGSITGISDDATMLSTKRLALIKQAVPNLQRVAMLWNRDDLGMSMRYDASAAAARSIGVMVQPFGVREPNDFDGVFVAMDRDRPDAILLVAECSQISTASAYSTTLARTTFRRLRIRSPLGARRRLDVVWTRSAGIF